MIKTVFCIIFTLVIFQFFQMKITEKFLEQKIIQNTKSLFWLWDKKCINVLTITTDTKPTGTTTLSNSTIIYAVQQYGFLSFQGRDTKLENHWPKIDILKVNYYILSILSVELSKCSVKTDLNLSDIFSNNLNSLIK